MPRNTQHNSSYTNPDRSPKPLRIIPINPLAPPLGTNTSPLGTKAPPYKAEGFMDFVKDGFAFGIGTSIARNFIDKSFQTSYPNSPKASVNKCFDSENKFNNCIKATPNDITTCLEHLEKMNKCLENK